MAQKQHQKVGSRQFSVLRIRTLIFGSWWKRVAVWIPDAVMLTSRHRPCTPSFPGKGDRLPLTFHLETDETREQGVLGAGSGPFPPPSSIPHPLCPSHLSLPPSHSLSSPSPFPFPSLLSLAHPWKDSRYLTEGRDHELITVTLSLQG